MTKCIPCVKLMGLKIKCLSDNEAEESCSISSTTAKEISEEMEKESEVNKKMKNIKLGGKTKKISADLSSSPFKVPRNKVALKPGRSLMDWIRLGNSGKDLTGVGGQLLEVTLDELKKHNKPDDAWLCIKGRVYNVTHYIEFHPGGFDEIEKGFGKDATQIFMQAHAWVNYESMLQKCIVGKIASTLIPPLVPIKEQEETKNLQLVKPSPKNPITYDWYQSNNDIVIVMYTKYPEIKKENFILDIFESKTILITIYLEEIITYIHLALEHFIKPETEVNIQTNGKVEIVLPKGKFVKWQTIGTPLHLNQTWSSINEKELNYRSSRLIGRRRVTKNTFLFTFDFNDGNQMRIPAAKHISLKLNKNEHDLERSYTPIPKTLKAVDKIDSEKNFNLMIKIYPDGLLTPHINDLEIGDTVQISDYFGSFNIGTLENCQNLVLLAAGTGVTPMISILHHILIEGSEKKINIHLVFCNKSEEDILWRDQLELVSERDKRFRIVHVLSEPSPDWSGYKGRISLQLVKEILPESKEKLFFSICGPTPFNQCCSNYIEELGYETNQVHVFPNN